MKNATYSRFTSLLCSVSLLTLFSPLFALAEEPRSQDLNSGGFTENQIPERNQPAQGVIPKESKNNDTTQQVAKPSPEPLVQKKEIESTPTKTKKNFWNDPYFPALGGSSLISLLAIVLSGVALFGVEKRRNSAIKQKRDFDKNVNTVSNLEGRIGILEAQLMKQSMESKEKINEIRAIATATRQRPISLNTPEPKGESVASFAPKPPASPSQPSGSNKPVLIAALNNGDRQQLREAVLSELNITSESENAIITGRSTNTELEVVSGGGSYLLVMLQGQPLLFPTEKTLKGFTAAQRSKGLFDYEQQTIAQPQLLEPALLEGSGDSWTVKQIGKIAIP